jgi:glucoside 3-dehydrogenase (cytochrome c) hitch-hiker subunit
MNRRSVLKGLGVISLYGTFPAILAEFALSCRNNRHISRAGFFTEDEFSLTNSLIDNLLPRSETPGGLDTNVPYFIDLVVKDCMTSQDQEMIRNGIKQLNNANNKFSSLTKNQQLEIVKGIDKRSYESDQSSAWFRIVKKLALIGHFTSQKGMTEALNYVKIPGTYKACIPYLPGEKALAKTFLLYW